MASPVSLTRQLGNSTTIDGTTTSVTFGGSNSEFESFANAAVVIPSSLTATIQVTNDNPDVSGATWTNLATGVTNKPITDPYLVTVPARGIKVVRTAGSGVVTCTILQSGGSSTVTISGTTTVAGNVASGATDSGNPVKVGGVYNTSAPTLTNGQRGDLQVDANANLKTREQYQAGAEDNTNGVIATQNKPLAVPTYAWSVDSSTALEDSTVTKASAGTLRKVEGRVDSTHASATYYWQMYNAASLPADGAVTLLCAPKKIVHVTGTDSNFSIDFTDNCIYASTGIVGALSTTEFTKTISGAYTSTTILFK